MVLPSLEIHLIQDFFSVWRETANKPSGVATAKKKKRKKNSPACKLLVQLDSMNVLCHMITGRHNFFCCCSEVFFKHGFPFSETTVLKEVWIQKVHNKAAKSDQQCKTFVTETLRVPKNDEFELDLQYTFFFNYGLDENKGNIRLNGENTIFYICINWKAENF